MTNEKSRAKGLGMDRWPIWVHFVAGTGRYNRIERWGVAADYRIEVIDANR